MNLTHWLKRPDAGVPATPKGNPRLRLEALESREVPAAIDFNPATGVLTLTGTEGANSIGILKSGADTQVTVGSEFANFAPGQVKRVNVFAGGGDDHIVITASSFPIDVQAGAGADRIAANLAQLNGSLNVVGGEVNGSDFLNLYDHQNTADTTYSLSAGLLLRGTSGSQAVSSVEYSGIRTIYLEGGSGDNNYKLESTTAPRVFMVGGKGDDGFEVAPSAQNLDAVAGASEISFLGGGGLDRLVAYDGANTQSATYALKIENAFDDSLKRTGPKSVTVTHTDFDILIVKGGSGSNVWNVDSHSLETYLVGGTASDQFVIGDGPDRLSGGVLGLTGGGGFDRATLYDSGQISAKTYELVQSTLTHRATGAPSAAQIVLSDIDNTTLYGGSGANTYNIQDVAANQSFTLFAGAGDDTIRAGGPSGLHTVAGGLTVFAGGGFNSLDVVDSPNGYTGTTYTLSGSSLTRKITGQAPVQIHFADVDDLDLFGGSASNTYEVQGVVAITDVDIQAGNGNDVFKFGLSNSMTGFLGTVSVSGNGGVDSLDVLDSANAAPTTYSLSASVLTRQINGQAQAQVSYNGVESVGIAGGSADNTFHVYSTNVGVSSTVSGGVGDDTFRVAPHGSNLNAIGGPVTVRGGAGTDSVLIDDSQNAVQTTYNQGPTSFSRIINLPPVRVNVEGLESATVLGGTANNTYNVLNTNPAMPVEFRAGSGADTFHVSPVSQTLRTTLGVTSFVGGGGSDTVVIHDELNPYAATYTLSADRLVRKVVGEPDTTIRFSGHENLIINAGTGDDLLTVVNAALAVPVTFNAGAGNDALKGALNAENTFEVTGPNAGTLRIAGGASALQFSNTENLGGGDRDDQFRFVNAGELTNVADGGFGSDTLDYAALTTGVLVDLSAGTATRTRNVDSIENVFGGSGDDTVRGNDLDNILLGNGGNDVLAGAAGSDILVGGNGSDTITGGTGRNVMIGGLGGDTITGGSDEDLLIAGPTAFDGIVSALRSVRAEWASAAPIATRVGHLQGTIPGGLNTVFLIAGPDPQVPPGGIIPDPRSVFDDGVRDILTGAAGTDWFFFSPNDSTDIVAGEFGTDTGDGTI